MDERNSPQSSLLESPGSGALPASDPFAALEDYRITNSMEIGSVLRQLMNRKDFLAVECSGRPHRIVTRILEVDQNAGFFTYDCSADQTYNQFLLDSEQSFFSATQNGVRIQFVNGRAQQHAFEGAFAFRSRIPESLYRMQRREFFRVETPIMEPYLCTVQLPDKRQIVLDIYDLSLNGVGLRSKDATLGGLSIGTSLAKAVLDCNKLGTMEADLKIAYLYNVRGHSDSILHFGCRFVNFAKSKEPVLQRMINFLELARRGRKE